MDEESIISIYVQFWKSIIKSYHFSRNIRIKFPNRLLNIMPTDQGTKISIYVLKPRTFDLTLKRLTCRPLSWHSTSLMSNFNGSMIFCLVRWIIHRGPWRVRQSDRCRRDSRAVVSGTFREAASDFTLHFHGAMQMQPILIFAFR